MYLQEIVDSQAVSLVPESLKAHDLPVQARLIKIKNISLFVDVACLQYHLIGNGMRLCFSVHTRIPSFPYIV